MQHKTIGKVVLATVSLLLGYTVFIPAGMAAESYVLVKDGKPAACIVLPDNFSPVEKHAASELSFFLEKVTGTKVVVQNTPAKELYNIYLGTTGAKNMPRSAAIDEAVAQLKDDGFVLAADKDGLRVIGKKPLGVLYGAYEILKKYAGMRWFAPGADYEYCPKNAAIAVPEQVTVSNPSFNIRTIGVVFVWNQKITDTWDWLVRNGMYIRVSKYEYDNYRAELEKRGAKIFEGGHCFGKLLNDSLFGEHPEYFPLINGKRRRQEEKGVPGWPQPCTSNPKTVAIMTESLNKILDASPCSYLIGNNDSALWCECENCKKLDPPDEKKKGSARDIGPC